MANRSKGQFLPKKSTRTPTVLDIFLTNRVESYVFLGNLILGDLILGNLILGYLISGD